MQEIVPGTTEASAFSLEEVTEEPTETEEPVLVTTVYCKTYTYDIAGNRISFTLEKGDEIVHNIVYTYDNFNRLATVSENGTVEASYTYDTNGIRTAKSVNGVCTVFLLDGGNVVGEVQSGEVTATYLRGANLISRETDTAEQYYIFNAHGDVTGLVNDAQTVTKSYDYDVFGNEKNPSATDANPFRYCGEYFDKETGTYYLRARYYDPAIGRFTQQDTHWNTANMIYGDTPNKINEREDALGLKSYTYVPSIGSIMQSGNLSVYCMNNPIFYFDDNGKDAALASELLKWSWIAGGTISQADSPLPGPADIVGLCVAIGGTMIAGSFYLYDVLANKPVNLPSYKKVKIDMDHIMSGHSEGGNRGGPNKDRFPIEMTASMIEHAIREAYKNAEKIGELQHSWEKGTEMVRQLFEGKWGDIIIQFWYNYTTKTIETAWPK